MNNDFTGRLGYRLGNGSQAGCAYVNANNATANAYWNYAGRYCEPNGIFSRSHTAAAASRCRAHIGAPAAADSSAGNTSRANRVRKHAGRADWPRVGFSSIPKHPRDTIAA